MSAPTVKVTKLKRFVRRLHRIGVNVELMGNFPWIYLHTVNGNRVTEKFKAKHGFTVYFATSGEFTDLKEIFKIIRKYKDQ